MEGRTLGKHCTGCAQIKPVSEFNIYRRRGKEFLRPKCKKCCQSYNKSWRLYATGKKLYHAAKHRARARGIEFNLDQEDVVVPVNCPVLDIPLYDAPGKRSNNSPSLDRVNQEKGYVKGNVAVISWRANWLKCSATKDEITRIYNFVTNWKGGA